MRIIHVITRLLRAGSEENTIASCCAQADANHEVFLVHGREVDNRYYDVLPKQIQLVRIDSLVHPLAFIDDWRALLDLIRLFRRLKPDLVHTHQSKAGILGRLAARAARVPNIVHGVHIVPFVNVGTAQRLIYLLAERVAARFTDAFIDVSRGMRDTYVQFAVGHPDKHYIIHSGFDLSHFRGAVPPEDWRELIGLRMEEARPPILLMLAALEPRKRHCEFLAAFSKVVERHPNVQLVICGEGPYSKAIEEKIQELGIGRNVKLIGYRTDPERIIALADLCVLTSTREGLPRVIMQYFCVGRACVVSNLPGLDEVVQHGVNGIVTPADDLDAAAEAVASLFADQTLLVQLNQGALATNLTNWEVKNMCRNIERVYQELANARRGKQS